MNALAAARLASELVPAILLNQAGGLGVGGETIHSPLDTTSSLHSQPARGGTGAVGAAVVGKGRGGGGVEKSDATEGGGGSRGGHSMVIDRQLSATEPISGGDGGDRGKATSPSLLRMVTVGSFTHRTVTHAALRQWMLLAAATPASGSTPASFSFATPSLVSSSAAAAIDTHPSAATLSPASAYACSKAVAAMHAFHAHRLWYPFGFSAVVADPGLVVGPRVPYEKDG